jgi:uncharacterized membrane protein HdeD (DUF308 family)
MNNSLVKAIGVVGIVAGSVALYFAGTSASTIGSIVGGVFVLAGIIAALFKGQAPAA